MTGVSDQWYTSCWVVVIPQVLSWNVFKQNYANDVIMLVWIPSAELNANALLVNGYACMMYIFLLDYMIGLLCQFEMYVNIMLENNKMVPNGCVKSTRRAMISPKGRGNGAYGRLNPLLSSVNLRTHPNSSMCFE